MSNHGGISGRRLAGLIDTMWWCFRTAIRPDPVLDPVAWYDRVIRFIGGLLLLAMAIGFIWMLWTGEFKTR